MPDARRGFYADAIEGYAFNTAIGKELPEIIKTYFPCEGQWCVSGLSMGGYGAFRLAFDYPETFVSATSHSGALMFGSRPIQGDDKWCNEFRRILGGQPVDGPNDLLALSKKLVRSQRPKIRFDVGTEDFLLEDNRAFVDHLKKIGYKHEYQEFAGTHEWVYWDTHIQESLAFHRKNLGF
jgi:S-formylglutathione hydrolase FrmB